MVGERSRSSSAAATTRKRAATLANAMAAEKRRVEAQDSAVDDRAAGMNRSNTFHFSGRSGTGAATPATERSRQFAPPARRGSNAGGGVQRSASAAALPTSEGLADSGPPKAPTAQTPIRFTGGGSPLKPARTQASSASRTARSPRLPPPPVAKTAPAGGFQASPTMQSTMSLSTVSPKSPVLRTAAQPMVTPRAQTMQKCDSSPDFTSAVVKVSSVKTLKENTQDESGTYMEPTKWKRWNNTLDKMTKGAHYTYIVGELSSALACDDSEKRDHDEALADTLHRRHPEDPSTTARSGVERRAAASAFTDRAARLREGRGARRAMMLPEQPPTEEACQGNCSCPVCCPHQYGPAGQPSHMVHTNRVARCGKDSHPAPPPWSPECSQTLRSEALAKCLEHEQGGQPHATHQEELSFNQSLGRKVKSPTPITPGAGKAFPHRSMSADCVRAAGGYNQDLAAEISLDRSLRRQPWQGQVGETPRRHGVALALSPRGDDPPPPMKICVTQKAPGVFKDGFSEEAVKHSTHYNQEMFRYSEPDKPLRARLQPAPHSPDIAGVRTGVIGNHNWSCTSPITMHGKDDRSHALGSTGFRTFRSGMVNSSRAVSHFMNHDECGEYFAMEKDHRLRTEPHFAAMCAVAQDNREWSKTVSSTIKNRNGHGTSSDIRTNLTWIEE